MSILWDLLEQSLYLKALRPVAKGFGRCLIFLISAFFRQFSYFNMINLKSWSTYSQRDRRGIVFPEIADNHSGARSNDSNYKIAESIALPDISSCVVMTSRRRMKKTKKKQRKKSARYFPEISNEAAQKEKEGSELPRSLSSAEEYSPSIQRKKKSSAFSSRQLQTNCKENVKLPNIWKLGVIMTM